METTKVWNEFSETLKRYILSKVKNETAANDILQEVFIKVHLNIDKVQQKERLKSWLYTITKNVIMDYFKKQSKFSDNEKLITNIAEEQPNDAHSHKDCLLPLILNLAKPYRDAMLLSEIKGLKQADVAKQLHLSLSGAKSRIQRGRKLLKQGFVACCDFKLSEDGLLYGSEKTKEDCKVCKN